MVSSSLKAAGAERSELSSTSTISAALRAGRLLVPEKMTSSISAARMALCELSPITQRSASTMFDLPQPFGPTTPVSPGSIRNSEGSTKDLKPISLSLLNCIQGSGFARFASAIRRSVTMRWRPSDGKPKATPAAFEKRGLLGLEHRVDDLAHRFQRGLATQHLAVDEEGGRSADREFLVGPPCRIFDRLRKLLIG